MKEEKNAPSWKGCIVFGIINILLVLLCTKLNIIMVSASMVLLIIVGFAVSVQSVKEDYMFGFKLSAVGCVIGVLLQIFAGILYVFNILSGIIAMFVR